MEAQRKVFIGGNWKCNLDLNAMQDLVNNVLNSMEFDSNKVEVAVFPTSVYLTQVQSLLKNKNVTVSNLYYNLI